MEILILVVGLISLSVSIPLLISTIGLRQVVRKELEEWATEMYANKERRTAEQTFFGHVMETNQRLHQQAQLTEQKYSEAVDQMNTALNHNLLIVKNAVATVNAPDENPQN